MKDDPVDPRLEKLVASLYNELSEEDERALQREIEADPGLRAEWEELRSTRSLFGTLEVEEEIPSFVLVDPAPAEPVRERAGFGARLTGLWAWGGWAVAAAAVLFLLFGMGGVHVQKLDNGFAFRFGRDAATVSPVNDAAHEAPTQLTSLDPRREAVAPGTTPNAAQNVTLEPVQGYMTQAEFDARSQETLKMVVALLNDYRSRRDQELSTMMQAVYGRLNDQQASDYRDLRGRIEAVGLGLREEQDRQHAFLQDLLGVPGGDSAAVTNPAGTSGSRE